MKLLVVIVLTFPLLMGCYYGQRSATVQTADGCYLNFSGNTEGVKVVVDENNSFVLGENENPEKFKPQKRYALQPGKHRVKVYKQDAMIIDQLIYISNNETKEFIIP